MVDKLPGHKNRTELAKVYFEFFKHFTTLSATAAVGIVTLRGLVDLDPFWLALSLGGFG